jgi:hypothetical protein
MKVYDVLGLRVRVREYPDNNETIKTVRVR